MFRNRDTGFIFGSTLAEERHIVTSTATSMSFPEITTNEYRLANFRVLRDNKEHTRSLIETFGKKYIDIAKKYGAVECIQDEKVSLCFGYRPLSHRLLDRENRGRCSTS